MLVYSQEANAQKATEIYIPVGKSPGLSGHYSKIGTVTMIDEGAGSFVITDTLDNKHPVLVTDSTRIWLDRTLIKAPNVKGAFADIREGLLIEVKYYLAPDSTYSDVADWIKIQITQQ